MPTIYPEDLTLIKGIVLMKLCAIFTIFVFHISHLVDIVEFITLKVHRVLNSMVCYKWGDWMNYTDRIRALREDGDLAQMQIAQLLKVGQKTYSDYELGKTRIPVDSLIVLARLYNVSMEYICGISDTRKPFPKS